ncbi:MAG: hypothetical protein J6J35_02125 [Alphaproteobacteria bacterium]|nr:hypothetical protein [Alphaproteobacteria bacterium]
MYFSTFMVIVAVCIVIYGYFEYQKWVKRHELAEKLMQNKEMVEMFEEYQKFLKKYPDFEKKRKIIKKLMKED